MYREVMPAFCENHTEHKYVHCVYGLKPTINNKIYSTDNCIINLPAQAGIK
jgi:hypothetical protein